MDPALAQAHARGEAAELGVVYIEAGYQLSSRSYVQPDVSVTHASQIEDRFFQSAPAIAIEIISPSNTVEQMDVKTRLYFEYGAKEVWRVHPKARYVAVYTPTGIQRFGESETLTTPLLPGFAVSVREIFEV
jgi:Uma2 family endonuclease